MGRAAGAATARPTVSLTHICDLDTLGGMRGQPLPPEVKAAAIAARLEGAGVVEVAKSLGISHNAVSKWSREAGIETPPHRPCCICVHPQRNEIDLWLIEHSVETVRRKFANGVKLTMLDRHRRKHLGMPVGVQGGGRGDGASYCKVCSHRDVDEINQRLREGEQRAAIAREYEPDFTRMILQHHFHHHLDNPQRDAAIATAAELRRQAYEKVAERMGPPKGWFVCPECESENVHSKGTGDWKEDPGPLYWHVTDCVDCGWPDPPSVP